MSIKKGVMVTAGIAIVVLGGAYAADKYFNKDEAGPPAGSQPIRTEGEPQLKNEIVAEGLSNVWDVAQAPHKTLFYTEREGKIGAVIEGKATTIFEPEGVVARGEGGLMGMALDPLFEENRYLFVCFNTAADIRLVRFKVAPGNSSIDSRTDIITGLPVNPSGRHSGCRPKFTPDGLLWIGTGDAARSENPQSPASLGGKILRIDREGGPAAGNLGPPYDPRIYSYGHRNVQGLAFYSQPHAGIIGYSVEHGPDKDDEVNTIEKGNYGWDPGPGYDESVPMTDVRKFPEALRSIWASGQPAIAPSGAVILEGVQWKSWEGRLMMAVLKDKHVRLLDIGPTGRTMLGEEEILNQYGRIRTVTSGLDGSIYLTTDNGENTDKIVKVTPN